MEGNGMRKLVWGVLLLTVASIAAAKDKRANEKHNEWAEKLDFTVSGGGVFSKTVHSSGDTVSDTPTKSGVFTGTVRYHWKPKHAFDINVGRTKDSQIFSVSPDSYRVLASITEFTADYSFTPFTYGKLKPFVLAGGGLLRFNPGNTFIDGFTASIPVGSQNALAFLYGGGADYPLWRMLSLRLQYRGLVFREPDFAVPALFFTGARGHMAEPSVGIVIKF